ncbi:MAG: hypothetical protein FWC40_04330 [Proteobacteria bacterium]|nr:hypothetical protein [Pseudomonadota bacterium]
MKRILTAVLLFALAMVLPGMAFSQTRTVAIFAPNLDFKDGEARNAYVSRIARILSDQTGMRWEGKAFARAADFEAARSNIDVAILDAEYFSSKGGSLRAVGMLSLNGATSKRMKVLTRRGGSDRLYHYRGKRLVLVASTPLARSFFASAVLGNEVKVDDFFASVEEARDVRSALNAVELGKADLTIAFEGYDSGFTTIFTSPPVALPIVAINVTRVTGNDAEIIRNAIQGIDAEASSIVNGISAFNATEAAAFRRIANERRAVAMDYQLMEPESIRIPVSTVILKERREGIVFNPFQVQYIPTLAEFDKKLDLRL